MNSAFLSCQCVNLTVGSVEILHNATLKFPLNGLTILRGENGTGKSCFLRTLLGLLPIQSGHILINGHTPTYMRQSIGYIPQKFSQAAPMIPVIDHVAAAINGSKWGFALPHIRRNKAKALLEMVGAYSLAQRPLGVISGGERQRVALAQALANTPSLLILDEPFAALDDKAHTSLLQLFAKLHKDDHINILITAHGALSLEACPIPTREILLEKGALHV